MSSCTLNEDKGTLYYPAAREAKSRKPLTLRTAKKKQKSLAKRPEGDTVLVHCSPTQCLLIQCLLIQGYGYLRNPMNCNLESVVLRIKRADTRSSRSARRMLAFCF